MIWCVVYDMIDMITVICLSVFIDDITWFKPVELWTKYGRRGHIKEPLGGYFIPCHLTFA